MAFPYRLSKVANFSVLYHKLFCINCFLNILLYEHAILWIVRDYHKNIGNNNFPALFGSLFEKYFEELLKTYVENTNFERIEEHENQRADWKLYLSGHLMLIEQKSSLLRLTAKQQETDIDTMKEFINRNIIHALEQLKSTEEDFNNGRYIKIILLYEEYIKFDLLDCLISNAGIKNDSYYWLVTIDEMEMLLYLYKNNRDMFEEIVNEKIKRHIENSNKGRNLKLLFREKGFYENQHLLQTKFKNYHDLIKAEAIKRCKN